MGQMTIGVLLGCKMPKKLDMDKWGMSGFQPERVRVAVDGDVDLVGVWLYMPSGEDGAVDISTKCLRLATLTGGGPYKKAWKVWDRFANWASNEGVELPWPELWMAPVEIA